MRAWGGSSVRTGGDRLKRLVEKAGGGSGHARSAPGTSLMSVTLEVPQLDMSALKFCKPEKSSLMSVMAETSQSATGPYVAIASVGSVLYAWTAFFSDAVSMNVVGQVPGPQLEP